MAVSNALTMPMAFKDVRGVPVFYPDHGAINGLEQAAIMSLSFRGDTVAVIDGVLNEHPYFTMGWPFEAGWLTQFVEARTFPLMVESLKKVERTISNANDREKDHFSAVQT